MPIFGLRSRRTNALVFAVLVRRGIGRNRLAGRICEINTPVGLFFRSWPVPKPSSVPYSGPRGALRAPVYRRPPLLLDRWRGPGGPLVNVVGLFSSDFPRPFSKPSWRVFRGGSRREGSIVVSMIKPIVDDRVRSLFAIVDGVFGGLWRWRRMPC